MIAHLYPVLLAEQRRTTVDPFNYAQVLQQPQHALPAGLVRMAAHMAMVRRARQAARRR